MSCTIKHCTYQPTDEEFRCPKCNAVGGEFMVDESGNFDCEKIHDTDQLRCMKCDHRVTGRSFTKKLMKKNQLVKCPHCKGIGLVDGTKEKGLKTK